MNDLPQVYQKYELIFPPRLIPQLRNLRGKKWMKLIDYLSNLPDTHPDALGFAMMMIQLGRCLHCEMDNYRAQRGCAVCARHAILSFKGDDEDLIAHYEHACQLVSRELPEIELAQAA
jgi:hypothetical protein